MRLQSEQGFTLLEVLMALTVFALIISLVYTAMGTASNGFNRLHDIRLATQKQAWIGKQLRNDIRYLAQTSGVVNKQNSPLRVQSHAQNSELWLLLRETGMRDLTRVHYYVDVNHHLIRDARPLLARPSVKTLHWDFGPVQSWLVKGLDNEGRWQPKWIYPASSFHWPRALRIRLNSKTGDKHQWTLAVLIGSTP